MHTLSRCLPLGVTLALACQPPAPDRSTERAALLQHHATILAAHRAGTVEPWLAIEADTLVVGSGGRVRLQDRDARREGRSGYLAATRFSRYEDLRDPRVEISNDGSLGWLVAEVAVEGMQVQDGGGDSTPVRVAFSWVELYRRTPDGWRLVGNVSNERALD
jgi:hypothetical protein